MHVEQQVLHDLITLLPILAERLPYDALAHDGVRCVRVGAVTQRRELRQPEVHYLDDAVAPHHHVLGFHVAMHHARGVGGTQRGGDLHGEIERFTSRDGMSRQALAQRLTLHELHRDELLSVGGFTEGVNGADVRMIERRRGTGFLLEAGDTRRVLREVPGGEP